MTTGRRPGGAPRADGISRRQATRPLAEVSVHDLDGITVVAVTGEVDLSNAAEISNRLTDLPNLAGGLVIDLRGTSYLDSTAIALLCDLVVRQRQRSQELVIVSPPGSAPRRVLEITGLHTQTTIVDEMAPAISLMSAVAPEVLRPQHPSGPPPPP